ncbi:regulatory factor Sgt1 [Sporothrix schenckii 1099-18]|uniref:Regulatory factor Sgt1 n=1 Tax=Sporothrix schenckii 1099-18 TaxID=1397361 RepID=A0A0F2LVG4_SPOSC|nr:regulatory factor Sgt1 [Sporothrix schenckii 1099-18]KJR79901.1 regulatory factor Sgt1 [Sporothrix schenckii 1099-18]
MTLESDTAEYMLFVCDDGQDGVAAASKPLERLDKLRKAALRLSEPLTEDYIWQRDGFDLRVVSRKGLLYLNGRTSFGDCVEDEWFIVYMLRELTKSFPGAWARICDSDGEFLLVEGARAVPSWLNPEIDANRIWIHNGMLKIIPCGAGRTTEKVSVAASDQTILSLESAVSIIRNAPDTLKHLPALDDEVFHRLRKYPDYLTTSVHYARLVLPRKIAYILHDRPRAVAPAVEAFVSRDPLTTKRMLDLACSETHLQFPPSDLVFTSVRFTRVMYAQLRGQRFTPPNGWPALFGPVAEAVYFPKCNITIGEEDIALREKSDVTKELSMKLTFGFEIMVAALETSNSRVVREVGLVLEDLAEEGDYRPVLPSNEEIRAWKNVDRESDEAWLNIKFEDFERELGGGGQEQPTSPPTTKHMTERGPERDGAFGFGDAQLQTDLRRVVSQFHSFVNDDAAGIDGAVVDNMDRDDEDDTVNDMSGESSDEEDDGVAFDEMDFSRLMRQMMGFPPSNTATRTDTTIQENAKTERIDGTDEVILTPRRPAADIGHGVDGGEDVPRLAAQFEAELKGHGALRLNPPKSGMAAKGHGTKDPALGGASNSPILYVDSESDDEGNVDVDFNLAKNLLESFRGQEGMSGPTGNILSMLGLALPRDKDNDTDGS